MKRFVSALLALCLLCSLVPVTGVSAEEGEASGEGGIKIVYKIPSELKECIDRSSNTYSNVYNASVKEEDLETLTFNETNNLFAFEYTSGGDYGVGYFWGAFSMAGKVVNAFEINVPETGVYTFTQTATSDSNANGLVNIYIIPKGDNSEFTEDLLEDKYMYVSGFGYTAEKPTITVENISLEKGKYYLAYKKTTLSSYPIRLGDAVLTAGDNTAVVDFEVIKPEYLAEGETGSLSLLAYYSDATSGEYTGEVSYKSSDGDVLSIDDTGAYEALSSGTVTVTVTANGIKKDIVFDIRGKSGITVVYDYASLMPKGDTVQHYNFDMTSLSFESSHNLWACAGYYGGDIRFRNQQIMHLAGNNYWVAMEVYVPQSGLYTLEQKYTTAANSGTLNVYMVPKGENEAYSASLINGVTPIISQSCDGADNRYLPLDTPVKVENKQLDAGYYYVVYKSNGNRAMFGNLTLNGGEGREFVDFEVIKPEYLAEGETGSLSVVAYYSDATSGEYAGEVLYATTGTDILRIDEDGAYEAISSGTAVVTVTAGGIEKDVEFNIKEKSGITVVYDYASLMPSGDQIQHYNFDMTSLSFENSGGLWACAGYYGGDIRFRNKQIMHLAGNNYWVAMEIYVPKGGIYTLEQTYTTNSNSGTLNVYMLPKGENEAYSASLITGMTPIISQSCDGADKSYVPLAVPVTKDNVLLEEGFYYVVYKVSGGNRAMFGNLTLNGGEGRELAAISFDLPNVAVKGDDGVIAPAGMMSDATAATVKDGYVFSSDNEAVISIDAETGKYAAVGKGSATVTVSYDIGRKKVTAQKRVEVIEGSAAGERFEYDFAGAIPEYEADKAFSELLSDADSGAYRFAAASRDATGTQIQYRDKFITLGSGEWFAFEIDIPVSGIYSVNQKYGKYNRSTGVLEAYIVPKTTDESFDINNISGIAAAGAQTCFDSEAADYKESAQAADFGINFFEEGKYYVVYKATGGAAMLGNLILDGRNTFKKIIVSAPQSVEVGKSIEIGIEAKTLDMSSADIKALELKYVSSDRKALTVEIGDNNECVIYGENEGTSQVTITAQKDGYSDSKTFEVQVIDTSEVERVEIDAPDSMYVRGSESLKLVAYMASGRRIEIPDAVYEIVASEPEGAATVLGNLITANAEGKITVKAIAFFKGEERIAEKEIEIIEGISKQAPTVYTYEMRENAKKNAEKYDWARSEVNAKKDTADKALPLLDEYYNMIIGEGIPRSRSIRGKGDPNLDYCPACGGYQQNAWDYDLLNRPWKVQCESCKRLFPSNDFESFLELGLDEQGYFSVDRAREAHHNMLFHKNGEECTCEKPVTEYTEEWYEFYGYGNKAGYLYNELYSDVGTEKSTVKLSAGETPERWFVDDGFGYLTGEILTGNIVERYCPVALYNYAFLPTIGNTLSAFSKTYLYTGETKYGVAAAILLDRIADFYPYYDTSLYGNKNYMITDGGSAQGKIQGMIQDSYFATGYATRIDEIFPVLKDEAACSQIIEYLNPKAEAMGLENKKRSAEDIWRNWEENILLEIFEAAKLAHINGNFGTYQNAVAAAALVLDKQPESDEMMEWCFKSGGMVFPQYSETGDYYCTGGNITAKLVDSVDRDGLGTESSASYNCMWWQELIDIAETTRKYGNAKYDLYQNVKFLKMLEVFADLVNVNSHTVHIGDCSSGIASVKILGEINTLAGAFQYLKDTPVVKKVAKYIALYYDYDLDNVRGSIFSENPEGLGDEIMSFVTDKDGFTESRMLGGYGFAALRAGKNFESASAQTENNNLRDFWLYFGGATSHRHYDALNLGIESYGLNFAPDLAYPTDTGTNAERSQWTSATLSHNTVTVDGENQKELTLPGKPLHFDDSGTVKVMDVSVPEVYESTSEYRRTVVMIEADDDVSYGIDFFRIIGGTEHVYSFHAQTGDDASVNGMTLVPQVDEPQSDWTDDDTSSYAGADVKYGADPKPITAYNYVPYYPRGTTWLRDVRRSDAAVNEFTANFKINDYNKAVSDNKDFYLSLTMVNDFELDEVAFAKGKVPTRATNKNLPTHLEYMLAKRTGKNLDSLFTTVYQPYKKDAYISSVEKIVPAVIDGTEKADDVAKAVKVTHTSGRVDYVIYATNENVTYQLENNADMIFKGFVGVWTANEDGAITYSYILGGEADVTGKISGFTENLSLQNYIDITPDEEVDTDALAGKYIFVEHDGVGNAAYEILSAEEKEDGDVRLNIGTVTTVRKYIDDEDFDAGYIFNIAKKQKFSIPMAAITDASPVFESYENGTVSANSTYKQKLTATSVLPDTEIEYIGRTLPRGASVNTQTGIFTWKPDRSQVGDNHVAITARDSDGRETTIHFTVTVYGDTTGSASENNTSTENSGISGEGTASGGGGGGGGGQETADTNPEDTVSDQTDGENSAPDASGETEKLRFTDLGNHVWAEDAINALADDGIVKGTTATTFSPANNITRADFALLLVRAFGLESDNTENFDDIAASDYFAPELAIARNTGIVQGIGDNKYAPRNTITRQDMMVIVYRALQKLNVGFGENIEPQYPDFDTVADYAKDATSALIGAGIVNGKSGRIAPTDYTTRAEVAVLLKRILEYIK